MGDAKKVKYLPWGATRVRYLPWQPEVVRYLPWPIKGRIQVDVLEKRATKNGVTYYRVLGKEQVIKNID